MRSFPALLTAAALLRAAAGSAAAAPQAGVTAAVPLPPSPAPAADAAAPDDDGPPPAVYGLFPLWEQTGAVEESGAARVGLRHAQVGVGRVTIASDPYLNLYGTLNAGAKLAILRRGALRLAAQLGWYLVPTAAETRGIGNLHAASFSNPYAPMTLLPAAIGATWLVARRVHLHASATALRTLSAEPGMSATNGGITTWVEWWATPERSVRLHLGAEGWPSAPQEHVGVSFGWRRRYLAVQAGYARRFGEAATSANTIMFDGAVLFP